jgi:hypothetical protein
VILGKKTAFLALCGLVGIAAACAQAVPVCPPPPPPAPCDRDLAPLASTPKPVIDDPLHPKDAEAPSVVSESDAGALSGDAQSPVAASKDGGPAIAIVTTTTPKAPPKPASADPSSCGTRDNLCPLQKLMRGEMAGASTGPALAAAFSHTANLSPNGGWNWRAISVKGAELAKSGDTAAAKQQCKACHDAYKESYKSTYRARAVR